MYIIRCAHHSFIPSLPRGNGTRMKVSELRPGMEHVDIKVTLKILNEPREVLTNYGITHNLVDGVAEDDSGSVGVTFWNEKIELLEGVDEGSLV